MSQPQQFTNIVACHVSKSFFLIFQIYSEIVSSEETTKEEKDLARLSILCGLSKYGKKSRAMQMYNECLENNVALDVAAYNAVIVSLPTSGDMKDFPQDWGRAADVLKKMVSEGVQPTVRTLEAILTFIKRAGESNYSASTKQALSALTEFKTNLGILPSLGAYTALIEIFCHGNKLKVSKHILDY